MKIHKVVATAEQLHIWIKKNISCPLAHAIPIKELRNGRSLYLVKESNKDSVEFFANNCGYPPAIRAKAQGKELEVYDFFSEDTGETDTLDLSEFIA